MEEFDRPRVVIVGGGFAGLYAGRALRRANVDVTLLDITTSHVFQPLLYQCSTGLLSEGQITSPLRKIFRKNRHIRSLVGEAVDVNTGARTLTARRSDGSTFELPWDYLIVGTGVTQSYFGNPQFERFAPGMKTIDDALTIRRRLFEAFEMAESIEDPEQRKQWLTFALVGAGPTGVELAGQIRELARHTLAKEFRVSDPNEARVLLFDGVSAPLTSFGPRLAEKARRTLEKLDVEMHLGSLVTDVDETGLMAKDHDGVVTRYDARTVLWTAGVEATSFAHTLAAATGAEQDKAGRIKVGDDLTIAGHANIFVTGDLLSHDLPGVAEVAMQSGRYAGEHVRHAVAGRARGPKPFKYHDLGTAAYISRGHALLKVGPLESSGLLGWFAWGIIHITFLTGYRNRFGASFTWFVTLARGGRRERATLLRDPERPQGGQHARGIRG